MVLNIFTKPPRNISEAIQKQIDRVKVITKDKNLKKTKEELAEIGKKIYKEYQTWYRQTENNRRSLVELNEVMEGVVEDTNFPFEGASNVTISYAAGMVRTFKATFNRTAYQDPDIFTAVTKNEDIKEQLPSLEEAVNYSFHSECNGLDTLRDGTVPIQRDGTLIISGCWDRDIEKCFDSKTYKTFTDFKNDYPTPQEAGISENQYNEIADSFIVNDDNEVIANYQFDNITYDGPRYSIISLAKFIYYPLHVSRLKEMKMYGKEFDISPDKLKEGVKRNEYYKEQVDELLAKKPSLTKDMWSASRNFIEKLSKTPMLDDEPYKLVDIVWKEDLDGDGIREKYLVTFSPEHKGLIISFKNYQIRNNIDFCVDFRLIGRDNRFLGKSLIEEGLDKFKLLDTIHRNRNNVRMLTTAPIMLINQRYKEQIDPFRPENIIKPGTAFYVDDVNSAMKQAVVQDFSRTQDSIDEETQIVRYLEFCLGPTQAMSGKETAQDPRAPMGKTIALLQQANGRIDDYLDEFRKSIPDLANLHCALLAQFGPEQIKYTIEKDGKMTIKELDKKLFFSNDIIWRAKRRSVTLSPEFAMQRLGGLMQTYASLFQLIQQGDKNAIEMWNRMVVASGEPQKEKLMIQQQQLAPGQAPPNNPIQQAIMQQMGGQQLPPLNQNVSSQSLNSPISQLNKNI